MTATWKIWNTFSPCNFQNWNDFPSLSTTMIAQLKWKIISLVWIFPEQFITRTVLFFKNSSAKSLLPCSFTLKDWDSCNAIRASSANYSEQFHSGELVLKMNLKDDGRSWFGFQMGYQPKKINSSIKTVLPQLVFKSSASLFAKAITACIFASARRWKEIISECPPQFTMSLCSQASLLSWKLTKSSWEVLNELSSLPSARPHQKLLSSAEWNLFSRIILRWDRCLCLPDVLWRPANLPVLPKPQDHRWGYWHE